MDTPGGASQEDIEQRLGARLRAGLSLGAFIAGLSLGLCAPEAPVGVWFALALLACAVIGVSRGAVCKAAMLGAVLLLGAGWMQARVHTRAATSITALVSEGDPERLVRVEGVVRSPMVSFSAPSTALDPPRSGPRIGRVEIDVTRAIDQESWVRLSGRVRLSAPGLRDAHVYAGQRVRVTGRLTPGAPGGATPWQRASGRVSGVDARIFTPDPQMIERVEAGGMLARSVERLRAFRGEVRRRGVRALGGGDGGEVSDARSMMLALLLGRREGQIQPIQESFRRIGAAHLLAISGFHLSVLGLLALWCVRLSGERGRAGSALVAGLIAAYLLALPARIPVVRAGVMLLALLASDALGRRHDRLALLGWVAIAVLVWRPADAAGLSFILSFGITALLLWLTSARHPWVFGRPALRGTLRQRRGVLASVGGAVRGAAVLCLLCWLVAAPVIACQTGRVSPIGAGASLLLTPLVTLDLGVGFVVASVGVVWPWLGGVLGGVAEPVGGVTLGLARWLESIPGATSATPSLSALWSAGATLWALSLIRVSATHRGWRSARLVSAGAVLALWLAWQLGASGALPEPVRARVDAIDVGDGTCVLVRADGHAVLWDAGSLSRRWGTWRVRERLGELGVWRVRTAVISHPNLDHYNALPELAGPLGLERVFVGDATLAQARRDPHGALAFTMETLRDRGVRIERVGRGDTLILGGSTLRVIGDGWGDGLLADNDRSLVLRLETPTDAGVRRALLTGDIQGQAMERLEREGADVRTNVLELPHHGSVSEEALRFVGRTGARVVVQSTGPQRGSDPRWNAAREGRAWLETPALGSVWVEIRADGSLRGGGEGR